MTEEKIDVEDVIKKESYRCALSSGIKEYDAEQLSKTITKCVFSELQGLNVYFPKKFLTGETKKEIIEEYNGTNVLHLVKKYGLTQAWIYKITKEKRDSKMNRDIHELAKD